MDYEPINGLQSLSQETEIMNVRKGDISVFCVAWCLWFIEFYIQNSNNKLLSDDNFKLLIPKTIKKLINSGYLISEYIRNYANYMHQKLVSYLTINKFPYSNIYYDKFTSKELDNLYSHINQFYEE
jgi:histidinol phosphatase-like enzyme